MLVFGAGRFISAGGKIKIDPVYAKSDQSEGLRMVSLFFFLLLFFFLYPFKKRCKDRMGQTDTSGLLSSGCFSKKFVQAKGHASCGPFSLGPLQTAT